MRSPSGFAISLAVHAAVIALLLRPAKRTAQLEQPEAGPKSFQIYGGRSPASVGKPDSRPKGGKRRRELQQPKAVPAQLLTLPETAAVTPDETLATVVEPAGAETGPLVVRGGGSGTGLSPANDAPLSFESASMTPPVRLSGPDPRYTAQAIEHEVQGSMQVRCIVGVDGTVRACRVVRGLPFMDHEVVETLQRRRYSPARLAGQPVEVEYLFRLELRLP